MKKCSCCEQEKPLSDFHKDSRSPDGHLYKCKQCRKEETKEYRKQNQDSLKSRKKEEYEKHKDQYKKRASIWKKNNPEKVKKSRINYSQKNRESIRNRSKEAYHKDIEKTHLKDKEKRTRNRDRERERSKKRRAKRLNVEGSFNTNDIQHLLQAQNNKCLMCGKTFGDNLKPTVDHIVPISKKGRNDITNLQILCRSCNSSKHTKTIDLRGKSVIAKIFEQFRLF